jgi:hypothetical protein
MDAALSVSEDDTVVASLGSLSAPITPKTPVTPAAGAKGAAPAGGEELDDGLTTVSMSNIRWCGRLVFIMICNRHYHKPRTSCS